jgi:hypothetical protein
VTKSRKFVPPNLIRINTWRSASGPHADSQQRIRRKNNPALIRYAEGTLRVAPGHQLSRL